MDLIHCIYASSATAAVTEAEIHRLLEGARRRNDALLITGMLLYIDGSFFQVLEGNPPAVDSVYNSILRDRRHERMTQIIREPIPRRAFAHWSMGFESLSRGDAQHLTGENDFFSLGTCLQDVNPGRAKKLLRAFSEGRWRTDRTGAHRAHPRVA